MNKQKFRMSRLTLSCEGWSLFNFRIREDKKIVLHLFSHIGKIGVKLDNLLTKRPVIK